MPWLCPLLLICYFAIYSLSFSTGVWMNAFNMSSVIISLSYFVSITPIMSIDLVATIGLIASSLEMWAH